MRVRFPAPPYSQDQLSEVFEAPVPKALADALNIICSGCSNGASAYKRVESLLGWLLAGKDQRYATNPAELFPIAGTGCDGGHYGYVIHAPELSADDYPIGRFEPMDTDDGVYMVGINTIDAIETELSRCLEEASLGYDWACEQVQDAQNRAIIEKLKSIGVNPSVENGGKYFTADGAGTPCRPIQIPADYRYFDSRDGVGVLAPRTVFHPNVEHGALPRKYKHNEKHMIDIASEHLRSGFSGTALWQLRELLHLDLSCGPHVKHMLGLMQQCYVELGRDILADATEYRLSIIG